ncbi:MAG: serine/threonine-protein kinase [Gemmataceae bacterium]
MQVRDIFLAAVDYDRAEDRNNYLKRVCGDDRALRARVEALLRSDAASEGFLLSPLMDLPSVSSEESIGAYKLRGVIGRGGMGVVYRAWDDQLERHVAVKLLQTIAQSAATTTRFRNEARVTARLAHPAVPPVYAVGEQPDGRPYMAMKLVEGNTLHALLAARTNSDLDRGRFIAVFEQICQAVAYAHNRGIIHRDLKPANVMVGAFGEVQVMDWGLAKEISQDTICEEFTLDDRSPPTDFPKIDASRQVERVTPLAGAHDGTRAGSILGTAGYMAPEQARGEPTDRRSDVFGLGAILCEILTGTPPFAGETNADTLRLNISGDAAPAVNRLAACDADPELIALCRQCLASDPLQRPDDAGAVAEGIALWRTHTEDRARRAERDRAAADVRTGEERKRRRVQFVLGSIAAIALTTGAAISIWQAFLARKAENETLTQLEKTKQAEAIAINSANEASAAAKLAAQKEKEALAAAADANAYGNFLANNFLSAARPHGVLHGVGFDVKISDAIVKAEVDIPRVFAGLPLAEARARQAIGITWCNLAKYDQAETQFRLALAIREKLLGPDHLLTLETLRGYGQTLYETNRLEEAEQVLRRVLEGHEKNLGINHVGTLLTVHYLATVARMRSQVDEAEKLFQREHREREALMGPNDRYTLIAALGLGSVAEDRGDVVQAETTYRRVLEGLEKSLGPDHFETLTVMHMLADLLKGKGKLDEAEQLFRRTIVGREKNLGPNHPATLDSLNEFALLLHKRGDYVEAGKLFDRAYEGRRSIYGPDDYLTLLINSHRGVNYWRLKRLDISVPVLEDTLRRLIRIKGDDDPTAIVVNTNLGVNYLDTGRIHEAIPLLERSFAVRHRYRELDWSIDLLVAAYSDCGQYQDAARILKTDFDENRKYLSPQKYLNQLTTLGTHMLEFDPAGAEPLLRENLFHRQKNTPDFWGKFSIMSQLGESLMQQQRYQEAEPLLLRGYEGLKAREKQIPGTGSAQYVIPKALDRLIHLNHRLHRPDDVKRWQAERAKYPREFLPLPNPVKAPESKPLLTSSRIAP